MANIEPFRSYQAEDIPWFEKVKRSLILYEPRMGKTVVACNVMAEDPECKVVLIVCPKNALAVWMDHLQTWIKHLYPAYSIDVRLVRGKGVESREVIWRRPRKADITVFITTAAAILRDYAALQTMKFQPDTVIVDEFHRFMLNRGSKTSEVLRKLTRKAKRFHALSGTSVGKLGPADLWCALNMCNPQEFSSYWRFVNNMCWTAEGIFGGLEILSIKDQANWDLTLRRYSRVRDRATHAPQMPTVQRDLLWVEPTPVQWKLWNELSKAQFTETNGKFIVVENSLEEFTRKRQILTCPAIIDPSLGVGAAFEDLLERMQEAKEDEDLYGHHIVIFTGLRKALLPWKDALHKVGFDNVEMLYGGLEPEELTLRIEKWRQNKGVILCTTQFAQAFSLEPATQCFHIGWEFNPNSNKQAEDRLVPQQGSNPINSYYYAYTDTDDVFYAELLTQRQNFIDVTLKST